jgi:glycolate oxidase
LLEEKVYREIEDVVGMEYISSEPAVLDGYAWQPFHNPGPHLWIPRPEAVVLPASTAEVQAVVRICNEHKVKFKALSTGWGGHSGPGSEGVIQLDLRRMDRILEIDEDNMFAVVEPYVNCAQVQAEVMRRGLNLHIIGAGCGTSPLASCTSHIGMGWSGIYMGFNGRNLLGTEWVLPSGELLRLGSIGSGDSWFSGDGPGPSLRGIMRGWAGADGGLGVFTRIAVKLFNWPGPPEVPVEPRAYDAEAEVPEHSCAYMCYFPSYSRWAEAAYKIGEAEIGYIMCKNAIGLTLLSFTPRMMRHISGKDSLKSALSALQHTFQFLIAADSQEEFDYQEGCLKQIISECEGVLIDLRNMPAFHSVFWWGLVRAHLPPVIFRSGGNFFTAFGCDESIDVTMKQAEHGERIKQEYISRGLFLDDLGDNAWGGIYENGLFNHQEELAVFDSRNPEQFRALRDFAQDCADASIVNHLGGLGFAFFTGSKAHEQFGPEVSNYHLWQRGVKRMLDADDLSDSTYYIKP